MARIKLTAGRIGAHVCPESITQAFLWDSDVTGLGLRTTKSGAKSFVFQTRYAGKALRITIGTIISWDIAHARDEARRLQRLVDTGIDPRIEKAETQAANERKRANAQQLSVLVGDAWNESPRESWRPFGLSNEVGT